MKKLHTLMLVTAGALALNGCGQSRRATSETTAPHTLIEALDTSTSHRKGLPGALNETSARATRLPSGAFVTAFRIDSECQEIFNGPAPSNSEKHSASLVPRLAPKSEADNTYLNLLARTITTRLKSVTGKAVIVIDTDGFGEGMTKSAHTDLASEVSKWGANGRVLGVFVCHVHPKQMAAVRDDFAGVGSKLTITPDGIKPDAVNALFLGSVVTK